MYTYIQIYSDYCDNQSINIYIVCVAFVAYKLTKNNNKAGDVSRG